MIRYVVLFATLIGMVLGTANAAAQERPRLILQITVDQLRGDLPTRYYKRLGEGGLKYLLDQGIQYLDAHHAHANTETIVGHATLATGAHPAAHGMVGNLWFDRRTGRVTYNIEDSDYPLLTKNAGVNDETEIDPTLVAAENDGRSPLAMLTSTFADELASHTAGQAKVFGVSVKDRSAVALAGRSGKAFWYSKSARQFVTSSYYYDKYPQWVNDWNAAGASEAYAGTTWELLHPLKTYLFAERDDQPWEADLAGYGRTFPHEFSTAQNPYFTTFLTISPVGDVLTTDFAKALIAAEELGDDTVTDFLSISYSSMDYVGHTFGPSSLESEDCLLRLDRTLGDLFAFIDAEIGLENTLIVLSADHGAPEAPGYLESLGASTGHVAPDTWETEPAMARLKARFGIDGPLIDSYSHPYVYLSNVAINKPGVDLNALEAAVADEIVAFSGVSLAVPATAIESGSLPDTQVMNAIRNNHHPVRSGNIMVVFDPGYFINDFDGLSVTVSHGSPWSYDTFVPMIFAGFGLRPQKVSRRVLTVDVARTLAAVAGTAPPSGTEGRVLAEVIAH
jgi:predicted AlkP superfamily pyrophosphatase or phosphodiesterase